MLLYMNGFTILYMFQVIKHSSVFDLQLFDRKSPEVKHYNTTGYYVLLVQFSWTLFANYAFVNRIFFVKVSFKYHIIINYVIFYFTFRHSEIHN